MDDGPDGLITGGDGGDESMKQLLLKQSETTAREDYGGMRVGNDVMSAKVGGFGDVAIMNDGDKERGDGGERAFGSKGSGYADHAGGRVSVSVCYTSLPSLS
jgi:hypothetical protein